jgi:hypothetical protein
VIHLVVYLGYLQGDHMGQDKMNIHNDNAGNQNKLDQDLDKKFAKSSKIINKEQMRKLLLHSRRKLLN